MTANACDAIRWDAWCGDAERLFIFFVHEFDSLHGRCMNDFELQTYSRISAP